MAWMQILFQTTKGQILYVQNDWEQKKKKRETINALILTLFYIDMTIGNNHTRLAP